MGIAGGEKLYVLNVLPESRKIILCSKDQLLESSFSVKECMGPLFDKKENILHDPPLYVRFRSTMAPVKCQSATPEGSLFTLEIPHDGIVPGQIAVFRIVTGFSSAQASSQKGLPELTDGRLDQFKDLIFLDVETTGLLFQPESRIVEISLSLWNSAGHVIRHSSLINPQEHIPDIYTQIHGINDRMVKDAPHSSSFGGILAGCSKRKRS